MIDLIYSMIGASYAGESRHPQIVLKELGINYKFAIPQSLYDSWWLFGCSDVPSELPEFITAKDFGDYHKLVGWGLSAEMAEKLSGLDKE